MAPSSASAAVTSPRCRSISTPASITAIGFTLLSPAYLVAFVLARVVERELHDPLRSTDRDRLDGKTAVRADLLLGEGGDLVDEVIRVGRALLELDAGIDVLGVLAHDHEVEVIAQVAGAFIRLDRAHERI